MMMLLPSGLVLVKTIFCAELVEWTAALAVVNGFMLVELSVVEAAVDLVLTI